MVSSQDLGPVTAYAIAVKYGFSGTEQEWANAVDAQRQAAPASHSAEAVSSESGVHGLRWYDKKLQAKNGEKWDDISTGEGWFPQNDDGTGLKHYTKYADGRLHEWGFQVGTITVSSAYGNMFLYLHYNINLLNHCISNVSCHVNIYSTGGTLVGGNATLKNGTDNVLDFSVLSPVSVTNITATFMYDLWSRWK